jgi:hypothetical protein
LVYFCHEVPKNLSEVYYFLSQVPKKRRDVRKNSIWFNYFGRWVILETVILRYAF